MPDFVGAVDQGTTSSRFMIFDHSGNEVARHQLEHEQILPRAGWVEHNPVEIWDRCQSVISTALNTARLRQDLLVLELVPADLVATVIEDHETGAGGALVDRADVVSHEGVPLSRSAER